MGLMLGLAAFEQVGDRIILQQVKQTNPGALESFQEITPSAGGDMFGFTQ